MKRLSIIIAMLFIVFAARAQYTQLTNLPTIYINTYNQQAIWSKTTYIYATMMYVNNEQIVQYDSLRIRG